MGDRHIICHRFLAEEVKLLKEGKKDEELWQEAEKLSGDVESLIFVKYLQLRAELIAKT